MGADRNFVDHAERALKNFAAGGDAQRYMVVEGCGDLKIRRVLDIGCGAGQQMIPFAEKTEAFCVGIDVASEVGAVGRRVLRQAGFDDRGSFVQARGENLPFAAASFDVVICRLALPYMDNRRALAEISRVLRPGGRLFLKTHAPRFYFGMIRRRLKEKSPKALAYPLIALAGGAWHAVSGKQPAGAFWQGREIFQTERFLRRALGENDLQIAGFLPDTNVETPSYVVEKK